MLVSGCLLRLRLAATLALFVALSGCVSEMAPVVAEPLRVGNVDDLPAESLGFVRGKTTLDEARAALVAHKLTGVVDDQFARDGGATVQVLGADYQRAIHVFRGGVYDHSMSLPTHGLPAYGLALRLARSGSSDVLLVLYRDPLGRREDPPVMLAFRWQTDRFAFAGSLSFEAIVNARGGMTHPLFVGTDLDEGVMLVARDQRGALWETAYIVRALAPQPNTAQHFDVRPKPMSEALMCSCIHDWAFGKGE
ncbi:MAG: hypothetical protein U0271_28490 [Polyangiaceae bacterium]